MRPIHLLLGLVVVLASGAFAFVATRLATTCEPAATELVPVQPAAAANDGSQAQVRQLENQLGMLAARCDQLSNELESLRNSANRAPAAASSAPVEVPESAAAVVTEQQRALVLAVLAEDRARQAAEAETARVKVEQETAQRRAARIAKELALSPGDETRLAGLIFENGKKGQEMRDSMRNGNVDRETVRTQFESMRTSYADQLTQAFGASIADQILQTEGDRIFGGGPGGGPGGGFGGQTANGGGGGGRLGRRLNGASGAAGGAGLPGGGGGQQQD